MGAVQAVTRARPSHVPAKFGATRTTKLAVCCSNAARMVVVPDASAVSCPCRLIAATRPSSELQSAATTADVAGAHEADLKIQDKYNVRYLNYWVDATARKVFCLVEAPDAEAAHTVHREAHGLVADEIYPVEQG